MAKLTINIGLPASGKSTESEAKMTREGNTVRINKDLLRTMLHFDKFNYKNEGHTRDASRVLATHFLSKGINVIIDDTNLNPGTRQSWVELAKQFEAKIEYIDMTNVPIDECIRRDTLRENSVGKSVIQKMAMQHLGYLSGESIVICDLDGTLCDIKHRLHFVNGEKKDWKSFFQHMMGDKLRIDVFEKLHEALTGMSPIQTSRLIFVSARPESYRGMTLEWLTKSLSGTGLLERCEALIMREDGDSRPDTQVKSDIYDKYLKQLRIIKVFDDRPSVIRMWREKGLEVEDVGDGIEF